jgi:hypothetical protein
MSRPFEDLLATASVRAVCVFSDHGVPIAECKNYNKIGVALPKLQGMLGCLNSSNVSEVILFYFRYTLFLRVLGRRILLVVTEANANPSLIRMAIDISENRWKSQGIDKLFPTGNPVARRLWRRISRK